VFYRRILRCGRTGCQVTRFYFRAVEVLEAVIRVFLILAQASEEWAALRFSYGRLLFLLNEPSHFIELQLMESEPSAIDEGLTVINKLPIILEHKECL
jgi:hypothetical protein